MKVLRENRYTGYGCSGPAIAIDADFTDTLRVRGFLPLVGVMPGTANSVTPCLTPRKPKDRPAAKRGNHMTL